MSDSTSPPSSPVRALAIVATAVAVGALLAWAGASEGRTAAGIGALWWVAGCAFVINWIVFVPSYLNRTDRFYDLTGSTTFLITTALALVLGRPTDARSWLLAAMIAIWAGRLGSFLFARIHRSGRDRRFDRIKQDAGRFLSAWTLQALWVVFSAAAAHTAITSVHRAPLGWWALAGVAVWLFGFGVEVVADNQKRRFSADPTNASRFINTGLWAWSRHPNYFGEIVLWIGVAIVAVPGLQGWQYATLVSPVFVTLLLTRISGIPLLEQRAERRWGDDPSYVRYRDRTPVLVPRPPNGIDG